MKRIGVAAVFAWAAVLPASANEPGARPVVVELFTSEGCSSCPPADALLTDLATSRPDILPLAFHVTYWNSLGWRDPFSFEAATARQKSYRGLSSQYGIYTPQMVIDGVHDAIGSDHAAVQGAIRAAAAVAVSGVALKVKRDTDAIVINLPAASRAGTLWLVGFDRMHRTSVGRGENAGLTLLESNVVRALEPAGSWAGGGGSLRHLAPAGERVAVLLQAPDGQILGAGVLP